jgi:type VI secretion system secreted protein VgrG
LGGTSVREHDRGTGNVTDREISVKTPLPGETLLLTSLEGHDEISGCFEFRLGLASSDPDIDPKDLLGKPVTVIVGSDEAYRHFHGIVTDFGFRDMRDDLAFYDAVLRPALWLMSLSTDNRIFQNMSVVDIVEAVLGEYPKVSFRKQLKKSYAPREYCVQYGESDLAFVQRLMEHEGIFYFFEQGDEDHTLVLCDDSTRLAPGEGLEKVRWNPVARTSFLTEVAMVAWVPQASLRTGKYAHTDYDFEKPSSDLTAKTANALGHEEDAAEAYHYPGRYTEFDRGDGLATTRLAELQAPHRRVRAQASAPGLMSGMSLTLEEFPREVENDKYIILRCEYRVWEGMYGRSPGDDRLASGFETTLDLQPASLPYRPPRRTPHPRMKGPQTAVVVGPAGEEIFTDKYSRVKVQFHWDREGEKDENTTCFIRVSSVWAGAGWGFIQIPRIGQEVIVDFLEGDPDQPIITGRVYNAEQMPPYGLPGNATQSGWKSNSSPGGGGWNELRFEDKKGSEQVYFQAEKDHDELVKNNETRHIGNDWEEDVVRNARQWVGGWRNETVDLDKTTHVKQNRTVNIDLNDTETVGVDRALTVGGDEEIEIKGDSSETIHGFHTQIVWGGFQNIGVVGFRTDKVGGYEARSVGGFNTQTVVGYRQVTVGGYQKHLVKGNDVTDIKGNQTLQVTKNHSTKVDGDQSLTLKGNQSFDITGGRLIKVAKGQTHDVTEDVWIKAGKSMMLEAADAITIKTGDAMIEMKKDGTITIKGKDISINGSGKINAKADGDVIIKGTTVKNN